MKKIRSIHAIKAWFRGGAGYHTGTKKPEFDETSEGMEEYEEMKHDKRERHVTIRTSEERE